MLEKGLSNGIRLLCMVLLCSVFAVAAEADKPSSGSAERHALLHKLGEDDLRALCSGMKKCMDIDVPGCDELDKKPFAKVKYTEEYCAPYHEVTKRGLTTDMKQPYNPEIFARLGRQYRAIYINEGTLPLNEHVISYLFDNMPFTAQLINAYLESNYVLEYTHPNRRYFNGSNGRSLSGEFYWALQDSAGQKLGLRDLFFGYGHAKILKWSLTGTAIAYLDMDPIPGGHIKYKLTAIVFPGNSVLNSIMQMNVFKKVVNEKIDDIVNDIKKAAGKYFGGDKEPMLKSVDLKSSENIQYILDFEAVVDGAPWKLGDFERLKKAREEARLKDINATPIKVDEFQNIKVTK